MREIRITMNMIQDNWIWCEKHGNKLEYEPCMDAVHVLDASNSLCPGLAREIELAYEVETPETVGAIADKLTDACTQSWILVLGINDGLANCGHKLWRGSQSRCAEMSCHNYVEKHHG